MVRLIPGIDVASYQGQVDWSLVAKAGRQFALIKTTEGTTYFNETNFASSWTGSKSAGLVRGAYHFGRPSANSGHEEASYFLRRLPTIEMGDLLALDLEDDQVSPDADLAAYTFDFLEYIRLHAGFSPLLYSRTDYLQAHKCDVGYLATFGLWLAHYAPTPPVLPTSWPFYALWQYASHNRIPGIVGDVDENLFNGDRVDQLKRYGKLS